MTKTAFAELLQKTARAQRSARRLSSLKKCAGLLPKFGRGRLGPRVQQPRPQTHEDYVDYLFPLNPTVAVPVSRRFPRVDLKNYSSGRVAALKAPLTKAQQARKPLTPGGVQAAPKVNPLDDITNRLHKGFSQLKSDPKAYFGQLGKRLGFQ